MRLENFSQEMEGGWSGETWEEEGTAELVLQQNVSRLEVRLGDGDQLEGEDINVTCTVEGGTPQPLVELMLMKADNTKVENSSERFSNRQRSPLDA